MTAAQTASEPAAPLALQRTGALRADVQGLRAVAVLSVIFYHLRTPGFPGGFVGVDVFFVISGFLVTGMLLREIDRTGALAIGPFLARRMRRLLPNAALTLLAVLAATAALLPRHRLESVVGDLVSAALFYSNSHFAAQAVDYFTLGQSPSPVLHFWSLSIEGQFYLLLPVMLLLVCAAFRADKTRAAGAALVFVLVASFAASLVISGFDQTKAFFGLSARCWQFALGGLLNLVHPPAGRRAGEALSALGLAGIAFSVVFFNDGLSYPGLYALLPSVSAAIILWTSSSWLLSRNVMQWVGDRSYSLYLWHWPVILIVGAHLDPKFGWMLFALSFALAEIAYRYVETPLRRGSRDAPRIFATLAAGAAVQGFVALSALGAGYVLPRLFPEQVPIADLIKSADADLGRNYKLGCHLAYEQTGIPENCAFGDVSAGRSVVLFGDSHAAQWFEPLEAAASKNGWKLLAWTKSSCPSADVPVYYAPKKTLFRECGLWRQNVLTRLRSVKPDLVVISNSSSYSGWLADPKTAQPLAGAEALGALKAGLVSTALEVSKAGAKIAVIADTPRLAPDYRDCLSRGDVKVCDPAREKAVAQPQFEKNALAGMKNLEVVSFNDRICGPDLCPIFSGEQLIYRDDHHLAAAYAKRFEPQFAELLQRMR